MVRNTLQKAVFADFLLARNRFRTNYKAIFLWDSSGTYHIILFYYMNHTLIVVRHLYIKRAGRVSKIATGQAAVWVPSGAHRPQRRPYAHTRIGLHISKIQQILF